MGKVMFTFLVGVDRPNICGLEVSRALTDSNLAGNNKLVVLEFEAPRMMYSTVNEISQRAEQIVDAVLRRRTDGLVCVGVASGIVPWIGRGNMPPMRYDCAIALHSSGRRSQPRHLNRQPIFLPHPNGNPHTPLETLFGLNELVRDECKVLRHRAKITSKSP